MNYFWFTSVIPISLLFSFRMLGLFMLIPVFTILAAELDNATPALLGLALGSYGLSQALLQLPFGVLSDHFGRKSILTIGLILFAIGSLVGAASHSIYTMIAARLLQGGGAIGSVLIALLADLTPNEHRTKAMAVIGVAIGLSFSVAMVLSPIITDAFGLAGIFYLTMVFALIGLLLLHLIIPCSECSSARNQTSLLLLKNAIADPSLQRLNIGIFIQHFILTATFYVVPILLRQKMLQVNILHSQWYFYLPVIMISFVLMLPFIFLAERKDQVQKVFAGAVFMTIISQLGLIFVNHYYMLCLILCCYFVGFNILEASLPALVSRRSNVNNKGTAMGVYSTSQFLGIFAGGACAGIGAQFGGNNAVITMNIILGCIWFFLVLPKNIIGTCPALSPSSSSAEIEDRSPRWVSRR